MRILLIGATGQLGSDLIKNNPGHHIVAPGEAELDVTRRDAIAAAIRDSPRPIGSSIPPRFITCRYAKSSRSRPSA